MTRPSHATILRTIAFFKFLKSASLVVVGFGLLKMVHRDIGTVLEDWILRLDMVPGGHLVSRFLEKATTLSPERIKELGIVSFFYAALFLTEGTGLWLLKHWAEWFTVIITGSLIPVEVYEIVRHPAPLKILVLLINVAVVWYLVHRIRTEHTERSHG